MTQIPNIKNLNLYLGVLYGVIDLVFCANCGKELPDEAYFCLKCGYRTGKGEEAGVPYALNWGKEVERALSTASRELEKAFETVRSNVQKTVKKDEVVCQQCGERNPAGSKFCYRCGKELKR